MLIIELTDSDDVTTDGSVRKISGDDKTGGSGGGMVIAPKGGPFSVTQSSRGWQIDSRPLPRLARATRRPQGRKGGLEKWSEFQSDLESLLEAAHDGPVEIEIAVRSADGQGKLTWKGVLEAGREGSSSSQQREKA